METDPVEILNRRNAEVAQIRGFADLTEEAKERRIAEVSERAQAEYAEAREAAERERAERLERTERAVFRVPIPAGTTDAEAARSTPPFVRPGATSTHLPPPPMAPSRQVRS